MDTIKSSTSKKAIFSFSSGQFDSVFYKWASSFSVVLEHYNTKIQMLSSKGESTIKDNSLLEGLIRELKTALSQMVKVNVDQKTEPSKKGLENFVKPFINEAQKYLKLLISNNPKSYKEFKDFHDFFIASFKFMGKLEKGEIEKYPILHGVTSTKVSSIKIAKMLNPILDDLYDIYLTM